MRRLSLDKTWDECLRMWTWITKHVSLEERFGSTVVLLKEIWLRDYYPQTEMLNGCFFCEYCVGKGEKVWPSKGLQYCKQCPGRLVDPKFNCEEIDQSWFDDPWEFYEQLKYLNRRRLAQKRRLAKRRKV
jgi:hypothetical protein